MDKSLQAGREDGKPTFAEIWSRNERKLWLYCVKSAREGAEDAFAQAAYSAFINYSACTTNSEAWLMRVTKNACTDYHRKRIRARTDQLGGSDDDLGTGLLPSMSGDPERTAIGREHAAILIHALASMPEHLRNPLLLTAIDGMRYPDVARRLGIREDALRKRISEGRKYLRRKLENPPSRKDLEQREWEEELRKLRARIPEDERQSIAAPAALTPVVITTDAGIERDAVLTMGEVAPAASPAALVRAERYARFYPRTRSGVLLLARVQRTLGNFAEAATHYEQLLSRNPRLIVAGVELAEVQLALGRNADAIRTYERIATHARTSDRALIEALAIRAAGLFDDAIARLIPFAGDDPIAAHFLGETALRCGRIDIAATALERAGDSLALTRLADVRMLEGRPFAAHATLRRALDLDFANVPALARFARMQIDARASDAADLVRELVRLAPNLAETAMCVALQHLASGDTHAARAHLQTYVDAHPRHARAWLELAFLCERSGDDEDARIRALCAWSLDAELRGDANALLARLGSEDAMVEARADARRAIEQQPALPRSWFAYGIRLSDDGDPANAIVALQKGWALLADDAISIEACEAALTLVRCFAAIGSHERAIEMARMAGQFAHALVPLAPADAYAYAALAADACALHERALRLAHASLHAHVAHPLRARIDALCERLR